MLGKFQSPVFCTGTVVQESGQLPDKFFKGILGSSSVDCTLHYFTLIFCNPFHFIQMNIEKNEKYKATNYVKHTRINSRFLIEEHYFHYWIKK